MVLTRILLIGLFAFAIINRFRAANENRASRIYTKEFRYYVMVSIAALAALVSLFYAIRPSWLNFAQFHLPNSLKWVGNALVIGAILLWHWSKHALGNNWSSRIAIRTDHELTDSGPYSWIRHPIYASYLILMVGIALATNNVVVIVPYVLGALITITRVPAEEKALRLFLGTKYIEYSKRTGRILPRLF